MTYRDELVRAMALVATHERAIFLGQAVRHAGTAMYESLRDVPMEKRVEFPVAENMQLGASTGLALAGWLPVSIYPRINFLLEAVSQLVQHLDCLPDYSVGRYRPRVIIRTAVASPSPLDPGPQHLSDYTNGLRLMLKNVVVRELWEKDEIVPEYQRAMERENSTLIVEHARLYDT